MNRTSLYLALESSLMLSVQIRSWQWYIWILIVIINPPNILSYHNWIGDRVQIHSNLVCWSLYIPQSFRKLVLQIMNKIIKIKRFCRSQRKTCNHCTNGLMSISWKAKIQVYLVTVQFLFYWYHIVIIFFVFHDYPNIWPFFHEIIMFYVIKWKD